MTDAAPLITALVYPSLATDNTHCLAAIYLPQNPSHRLRIVCQPPDDAHPITLEAGTAIDPLYVHVPQLEDYHALMCRAEAYQLAEAGEALIAQSPPVTLTWPIHIAAGDDATEPT